MGENPSFLSKCPEGGNCSLEGSLKELAGYRMDRAKEMLVAARENLEIGQYKTSLNRSYYAIFHAMRAMNILKGFDSSKHSGVIAFFNKEYLKENILDRNLSIVIKNSAFLREKSDYDDFYIASKQEAEKQLEEAERFLDAVEIAMNKMK